MTAGFDAVSAGFTDFTDSTVAIIFFVHAESAVRMHML